LKETEDKGKKKPGADPEIEDLFEDEGTREFLTSLKKLTKRNQKFVEGISGLFFDEEPSGGDDT
jgi:hypothetical protein